MCWSRCSRIESTKLVFPESLRLQIWEIARDPQLLCTICFLDRYFFVVADVRVSSSVTRLAAPDSERRFAEERKAKDDLKKLVSSVAQQQVLRVA